LLFFSHALVFPKEQNFDLNLFQKGFVMIKRYQNEKIAALWEDENKLTQWQIVELHIIRAREKLGIIPEGTFSAVRDALKKAPFTPERIARWLKIESETNHDLNAFVQERREMMPEELQRFFHDEVTSYDTEEPAFVFMLRESVGLIYDLWLELEKVIIGLAKKYRYTLMNARTHGQEAELQTFGRRCLSWLVNLRLGADRLSRACDNNLCYSKLSGAIGNYGTISPELEKETLAGLSLHPFYGATQIMPREIYLPTAQALCQIVQTIDKIATDIRLMARSGNPLAQEPFGKKQTGSSAMPHKKNTIATEKGDGLARIALGFLHMIEMNIKTWEERAIEQSSVERVAWPDLFHITAHAITTMTKTLSRLNVYPDNMLREIVNSRGVYAAAAAKDFLKVHGAGIGISADDAYRIVQLAAFNLFEPNSWIKGLREKPAQSLDALDKMFTEFARPNRLPDIVIDLDMIIREALLGLSPQLEATEDEVNDWNKKLGILFKDFTVGIGWANLFTPSFHLKHEATVFKEVLGE
jgi:adenylosuccinate lyase